VQKDFDTIEKMEFLEKSFHEIKEFLKRFIEEVIQIDNILPAEINPSCLLMKNHTRGIHCARLLDKKN